MTEQETRILYVWELPVRLFHWVNAIALTVLIVTGLIIGNPPAFQSSHEAYFGFWFGWVRFFHFAAAYIFLFNLIYRLFWAFLGNRWAQWRVFFPFTKRQVQEMGAVIKVDVLQVVGKPVYSIGHNSLAALIYFIFMLLSIFQIFTGFTLYAAMSDWWFAGIFAWIYSWFGSDISLRYWHHLTMWFFILFTFVHVYLVAYHDYIEGRGVLSSMVGGWKFITKTHSD